MSEYSNRITNMFSKVIEASELEGTSSDWNFDNTTIGKLWGLVTEMNLRIAELEKQSEHWHSLYQVKSDLLDGCERGFTPELEQLQKRIAELEVQLAEALPYEINEKIRKGDFIRTEVKDE